MRIRSVDTTLDRQIITGMVVSDQFLKSIQPLYRPELLMVSFAVTVASWCLRHFAEYGRAPKQNIQDIFYSEQRISGLDGEEADLIEQFLQSLSSEYERADKFNVDYLLDQTEKLFRQRHLKHIAEDIENHISRGELDEAEDRVRGYKRPERPQGQWDDPLDDIEGYQRAFESREHPLFRVPGALGELLNPHLIRGGFVALLGREKIGKTWRMHDLAMWALRDRCNVAFFQLGDLTRDDFYVRMGVYTARRSHDPRYCGELFIPVLDCLNNQLASCPRGKGAKTIVINSGTHEPVDLEGDLAYHKPCTHCKSNKGFKGAVWYEHRPKVEPLDWREAHSASRVWARRHRANKRFRLATYARGTMNMAGVERQLDLWQQENGWVADVIFLDYPDIMSAEPGAERMDTRHQENERWAAGRRMSQERHACVIAVTQSNKKGHEDGYDLKAGDQSEDKRKLAHVTAFFALNQTKAEKKRGITRVASIGIAREGDLEEQIAVLQCLSIGRPYLASYIYRRPEKTGIPTGEGGN